MDIELVYEGWEKGPYPKERQQEEETPAEGTPTRAEIVRLIRSHESDVRAHGVASLNLFGSVARDEAGPNSDVDLLVTFAAPVTSDSYFGLKFFLEDLLHRPIDLVTDAALREPIRRAIGPELLRVA
jgi:predicted nucleotidyltransferase